MIRVLIASAAYGGHNIGDDAILTAMVEQLKGLEKSGISVVITAVTRQPAEMAKRLGIRTLEFDGLGPRARTYLAIATTDVLIVGGGALIAGHTRGWKGLVTGHPGYPMTMVALAKLLRKRAMVYGAGVEKIESPAARFLLRKVFDRADMITLRDEDSKKRLVEDLGVRRAPVVTTADPVLALQIPSDQEMDAIAVRLGLETDKRPLVVINFAYGLDRRDTLIDFIAKTADYAIEQFGARILFVPMNILPSTDRFGMSQVIQRMAAPDSASILDLPYTHAEVLSAAHRSELVISSRMHLLIMASLVGTPICGISRVPKVDAFLERYGLEAAANTEELEFKSFRSNLEAAWKERSSIRARLEAGKNVLANLARQSATCFTEIL